MTASMWSGRRTAPENPRYMNLSLAMFCGLKGEGVHPLAVLERKWLSQRKARFESGGKTYLLERDFLDGKNKGIFIARRMIRSFPWRRIFRSFLET